MKIHSAYGSHRRSGFSIVELCFVAAILFLVIGSVALIGQANERAYRLGATKAQLEAQADIATERVVSELRIAALETLDPNPAPGIGASSIRFQQAIGYEDGEVVLSTARRLALALELEELDDGFDNNGNGLIDERRVVLTMDVGEPQERQLVLTRWVSELLEGESANGIDDNGNGLIDEPGFCLEGIDETLLVRLSLARRDSESRLLTRTTSTSVRIRN